MDLSLLAWPTLSLFIRITAAATPYQRLKLTPQITGDILKLTAAGISGPVLPGLGTPSSPTPLLDPASTEFLMPPHTNSQGTASQVQNAASDGYMSVSMRTNPYLSASTINKYIIFCPFACVSAQSQTITSNKHDGHVTPANDRLHL